MTNKKLILPADNKKGMAKTIMLTGKNDKSFETNGITKARIDIGELSVVIYDEKNGVKTFVSLVTSEIIRRPMGLEGWD